ncbi:CYTH domain-containing protein [Paraglaciecola sp. 20A4]|uniref:CYTH domain-containing protein n=1 Tax=Paraglaciecola sp. 20A4 TaxID=2687288 RepID=UPI00140AE16A|nr:CYTH domain-containing protein [Paraglaciecola sp. 20A4]
MDIEIELKLLATPSAYQDILSWLAQSRLNYTDSAGKQLRNDYFETTQRTLRKHDIGLRIRGCNGEFEQTVKTKGIVVAGMHQRPEYNVPLPSPDLKLDLFDPQIWPKSIDLTTLENDLYLMFSTDFLRHTFVITLSDATQVELVFDQGSISANGRSVEICEVELELKKGDPAMLFEIAQQLVCITPLRFGMQSKAARGYRLADNAAPQGYQPPAKFNIKTDMSTAQGAIAALEQSLNVWQGGEDAFYQSQSINDWRTIKAGMLLVQETLSLFEEQFNPAKKQQFITLTHHLTSLLEQHAGVELCLSAQALSNENSEFLVAAPHAFELKAKLATLASTATLLTKMNNLLSNKQNIQLQLAFGALLLDESKAPTVCDRSLRCFIDEKLSSVDDGLASARNKLAFFKVLCLDLKFPIAIDKNDDPWSVLRQEDKSSLRTALIKLLRQNTLGLQPEVTENVLTWCIKN